jgi:hypothetical protein
VILETLSREYGWTPDEARAIDAHDLDAYLEIIATRRALEREAAAKAQQRR